VPYPSLATLFRHRDPPPALRNRVRHFTRDPADYRPQPSLETAYERVNLIRDLEQDAFDGLAEMTYCGNFYAYEIPDADHQRNRTPLYIKLTEAAAQTQGFDRCWSGETLVVFLNNLGNDWWCCRRGRVETIAGCPTFTCTFRHLTNEHWEIHIAWPLQSLPISQPVRYLVGEDGEAIPGPAPRQPVPGYRGPPEVSVSFGWIHPWLPTAEEIERDTVASQHPGQDDDPEDEAAAVAESDLYARPREPPEEQHSTLGVGNGWQGTKDWITEFCDSRHRATKNPQTRLHCTFEGQFPQRESSSWIWRNDLLLLHDWRDFSWPMRYFVQKLPLQLLLGFEIFPFEQLLMSLRVLQKVPAPSHSQVDFLALPGLLGLNLSEPSSRDKRLQSFTHSDHEWSILSGYWVSPFAESILRDHEIDGLIMDTTFRVMSRYYTAILVAVIHNVGVPLAISFGPRETVELYDTFYQVFNAEFGVDLRQYILESDQGSALKAVGALHPRHLFCLRHVLKSLHAKNCGRFASLVGNLISARSQKELKVLLKVYADDFATVYREGGEEANKLTRCLKKVGLFYRNGTLLPTDADATRWKQVSMLERLDTNMPTTSNTIESLNGRLNGKTPRFNCFWGSLHRLREAIIHKTDRFHSCLWHNMGYEKRKATRRFENLPPNRMTRELAFFHTGGPEGCLCGETAFARTLYRADFFCSHRLALWSRTHGPFDRMPNVEADRVVFNPTCVWTFCEVKMSQVVHPPDAVGDHFRQCEVMALTKLIVRDAHAQKRKEEVLRFVDENLVMESDEFALGQSGSFLDVHRRGLIEFRGKARAQADVEESDQNNPFNFHFFQCVQN
jgi:hypothetical protein